ncbi:MAG: hypothetical protein JRI23_11780 [Deltaproteobacteria bacterium]|jgi:hypothetical protein|nr:hypothetical protein [Deltaproteobacteria bacterium]MBW2532387.1 hypothetical protein [Deltaproteobacteria bacterium]
MPNLYCDPIHLPVPSLETVKDHREASPYSLLIVALLEHGGPMTLPDVAARFARAGIAPAEQALRSLKRCRPARSPVYRDGDRYELDPHDAELDLWAFRLGLRPPRVPALRVVRPPPEPLPGPDAPLTVAELKEAFSSAWLANWSAQRVALAVLEAHGGRMLGSEVIATLTDLTPDHRLRERSAQHWRRGAPITVGADGTWTLDPNHPALVSARKAVRERIEIERRNAHHRPDPTVFAARRKRAEALGAEHAAKLARLRRGLLYAFPAKSPKAVVVVDVAARELRTFSGDELADVPASLEGFDLIAAIDVRPLLRALGCDPSRFRLADLGPPQKTLTLDRRGRTLKITTELLIQGSCGISKPFGSPAKLRGYLKQGQTARLHRRLESNAKALFALYQYGRLHHGVRLRWGFLDERLHVPWAHWDEPSLRDLFRKAVEQARSVEIVAGSAPAWSDPWSRAERCEVVRHPTFYDWYLFAPDGREIPEAEVQLARLGGPLQQLR